jgi:two-component system CheB/CheR fusion protein
MRVLLIDDDQDTLVTAAALLHYAGHQTCTAPDGSEGLRLAAAFGPDAVLVDLWMPNMDGYELAQRLRQIPNLRRLRIVAVSGARPDIERPAVIDYYLLKPASLNDMLKAIGAEQIARLPQAKQ